MSFRDEESVNDEIALILRSMARTMKLRMTTDDECYTIGEFELDMRAYVLQAYQSGYYDGKGRYRAVLTCKWIRKGREWGYK